MTPATNWLSFSLSPMEMLRSSNDQTQFTPYLIDNFYANGWTNPKSQAFFMEGEGSQARETQGPNSNISESPIITSFIDPQSQNQTTVPKLEDFLGDSSSMVRYSDSQTETQDSSLTQIYDQGSVYFNQQQDLKTIAGFQAFSTNSGSEVDDSVSIARTQLGCGEFIELSRNELGSSCCPGSGGLAVGIGQSSEKGNNVVSVHSEKKIADTFGQRTSIYRGVTRHRWTGRYEAHLWDNSCRREGQARKGRQVYLGGYDKEDKAARAYDLAALKYWGPAATTNFPVSNYAKELEDMKHATKQEFIASLRRKSSGFSRGASIYRGVTRHHQQGRWQARIGRVAGNKDLYLGTFATEEEAAEAYDIAAIKFRGLNAVTNFEMNRYDVEAIAKSSLPVGGAAKRLKFSLEPDQKPLLNHNQQSQSNNISICALQQGPPAIPCGIPFDAATMLYHQNLVHNFQLNNINIGSSDSSGSVPGGITAPMNMIPQPGHHEFYLWPHQSYNWH